MNKKDVQNTAECGIVESSQETDQNTDMVDIADIDFSELMDLRVDYAFKLCFSARGKQRLICLLNAIFENKRIPRVVTDLTIMNPSLEKASVNDKFSVLDILAALSDGSHASVEMHMYGLLVHKRKTVRSWSRIYGENLEAGKEYSEQTPAICISFMNGPITDVNNKPVEKIHSLFQVLERDSREKLLDDMELHYIDMKAFVKHFEEISKSKETKYDRFTQWLAVITLQAIKNKEAVRRICGESAEIKEAVKEVSRLSQEAVKRHAYQRRLDELRTYNNVLKQIAEKDKEIADKDAVIEGMGAALADKDSVIADKDAALADKDAALADKDALIAKLQAQLGIGE